MIKTVAKIGFAFFFIIIFGFTGCSSNKNDLPEKLGDLSLFKVIQGNEAVKVVDKMHGKRLGAIEYLIGYYGNDDSKNILYVSVFENAKAAKVDLMNMAMKMARGTSVFAPLTFEEMGEKVSFRTEGMGLVHYFYRVDNILLWWQVETNKAESTYDELLKFDFAPLKE